MKKWIAALLTLVLIVGALPAALAVETKAVTVQVGFGQVDVTPILSDTDIDGNTNLDPNNKDSNGNAYPIYYMQKRNGEKTNSPIHVAGNFDVATRFARGLVSEDERLYMKAVALSDGTNTQVVMTTDFIRVPTAWNEYVEAEVLSRLTAEEIERYCLTEDFVSMSATHTHSSIDIGDRNKDTTAVNQGTKRHNSTHGHESGKDVIYYEEYWLPGAVDAVLMALEDLAPTTIRAGAQDFSGSAKMNWVRHWSYSDGTMNGVNFDSTGGTPIGHTREADPEMQVIHFVRAGAKDIVLVNYQAHPTGGMGQKTRYLTSEYCGILCNYLEDNYTDEDGLAPHAAYFQGAAGNIMYWPSRFKSEQTGKFSNYVDYGNKLGELALGVLQSERMVTMDAGPVKFIRNEHTAVERGYTHTRTIQQDAVAVGGAIAFVTAGYEMFDSTAMFIKNNSPYAVTFVIENAQGHEYMPDWQTCHYTLLGGPIPYENWDSCHNMVPGTAEDLADCLVSMLNILYES